MIYFSLLIFHLFLNNWRNTYIPGKVTLWWTHQHIRGGSKTPEMIFWRACPLVQASLTRCVLVSHLHQCTRWCCYERLHLASLNFFFGGGTLSTHFAHFRWVVYTNNVWHDNAPAHTTLSVQIFYTKNSLTAPHCAPPSLFTSCHPE